MPIASACTPDAVITICPALADHVGDLIGDDPKHFLIENSIFDPVRLLCESQDDRRREEPVAPPPGKKIVIYEKGFLNWLKPEHGQYGFLDRKSTV